VKDYEGIIAAAKTSVKAKQLSAQLFLSSSNFFLKNLVLHSIVILIWLKLMNLVYVINHLFPLAYFSTYAKQ
jgi:hypothetical protein